MDLMVDFEGSCASKSYIYILYIYIYNIFIFNYLSILHILYLPTVTSLAFFGNVATYSSIVTSKFSEALARSVLRPGDMQRHGEHIKELLINKPRLAGLPDNILPFATWKPWLYVKIVDLPKIKKTDVP